MHARPSYAAVAGLLVAGWLGCSNDGSHTSGPGPIPVPEDTTITEYDYTVEHSYPHDTNAFTEGLIWDDSALVEGTGYFGGPSTLRRVELKTGQVIQSREAALRPALPHLVFGEGITRVDSRIVELTWTEHVAWIYDAATFDSIGEYTYPTEGWGLTHDGTRFIMSDGTSTLYFRNLSTFDEIGRVTVRDENGPVTNLNELEFIDGRVWANVYQTTRIVMIDPTTGRVRGRLELQASSRRPPTWPTALRSTLWAGASS